MQYCTLNQAITIETYIILYTVPLKLSTSPGVHRISVPQYDILDHDQVALCIVCMLYSVQCTMSAAYYRQCHSVHRLFCWNDK